MIRVMVVDDSALVRKIATDILTADPEITVAATAANAEFAIAKLERERPDVITLDLEMPGMGGLEAIRRIMNVRPTPIIVMSAHAQKGAELTLQALEAGAVDFVLKPSNSLSGGIPAIARELTEKVRDAARIVMAPQGEPGKAAQVEAASTELERTGTPSAPVAAPPFDGEGCDLVAIGTSTGGPVALKTVLMQLPGDFPVGVVIVQHMPPVFTKAFADRLDSVCAVRVKEAENGDPILPGRVLIAPGNWHMMVTRFGLEPRVVLNQNDPVNGHRPSVDVLMRSVAREYGSRAVGVIMTGMGKDGAEGLRELYARGGRVIAQDKNTSVIYGMNKEVVQNGNAHEVMPVDQIASRLRAHARGGSAARSAV
ncbi:MAG: protein-glutamate methylesterase/protein-glutamine glutaminase [Spirochaetia bacterium]